MRPTTIRTFPMLSALLVVAAPVHATVVEELDLSEMVRRAGNVVHARVIDNRVEADEITRYQYTITRFQVIESAKGALGPGGVLELRLIGGRAPGSFVETVVADIPRFRDDEQVVLFTTPGRDGRPLLLGLRGALRLDEGAAGPAVLSPPVEGSAGVPGTLDLAPAPVRRAGLPRPAATREVQPVPAGPRGIVDIAPNPVAVPRPPTVGVRAFLNRVRELVALQHGQAP